MHHKFVIVTMNYSAYQAPATHNPHLVHNAFDKSEIFQHVFKILMHEEAYIYIYFFKLKQ